MRVRGMGVVEHGRIQLLRGHRRQRVLLHDHHILHFHVLAFVKRKVLYLKIIADLMIAIK